MNNKKILIFVIVAVLVVVGILSFILLSKNNGGWGNDIGKNQDGKSRPIIEFSLENPEENQENVRIVVKASMDNGTEIASIILPNGSEILGSEAKYEVNENGEYTFKAIAKSGEESEVSIDVSNIREASASKPYIPSGFKPVKDTEVESGFIIEDSYGNQYVWVPVSNGQLVRETMLDNKYEESASTATALVNSVAQNYGFYIGRYEASAYELEGETVAASMAAKNPWTDITFQDAEAYANSSAEKFGYEDVNTAMLNSYAWDTVLKLFDSKVKNYSTSVNYGNYSGSIYPTGATPTDIIYNICDIAGNTREWTTEIYKEKTTSSTNKNKETVVSRVIRGGGASLGRTPKSHNGYPEDTSEAYWGFRLILYK